MGLFEASGPLPGPLPSLFLTFFWASLFLGFFGPCAGLLWASEPLPGPGPLRASSTLLGASGILWAFLGFSSGPFRSFWTLSGLWASSQPFLGLAFWTFSGPGPVLGLLRASSQPFLGFSRLLDLDLFPAFSGPRNLYWAFSLLGLLWASELLPSLFWASGLFWAFSELLDLPNLPFSGPLPSLFWASGLFWPFVGF